MIWMYAVAALCLFVCLPFYMHYKRTPNDKLAHGFKVMGTLCAVSFALIAALRLDPRCWVLFAGMMLHAIADWLLEYNLYWGGGFFLAGHICYIAYFLNLFPVSMIHLIALVCLVAVCVFLFIRWRKPIGINFRFFGIYAALLCITTACAIGGLSVMTTQGVMIAMGGAFFFLSDLLILGRLLFSADRSVDWAIMILYYLAQLLIGASCLV